MVWIRDFIQDYLESMFNQTINTIGKLFMLSCYLELMILRGESVVALGVKVNWRGIKVIWSKIKEILLGVKDNMAGNRPFSAKIYGDFTLAGLFLFCGGWIIKFLKEGVIYAHNFIFQKTRLHFILSIFLKKPVRKF